MTIQINSQDFIQTISSEEQVAIFFSVEDSNSSKIENKLDTFITKSNEDSVKPYKIYKLSIEDNDKNYELCQHLNVEEKILIVFKNACFNRYKNKDFTDKELKKFLSISSKKKGTL